MTSDEGHTTLACAPLAALSWLGLCAYGLRSATLACVPLAASFRLAYESQVWPMVTWALPMAALAVRARRMMAFEMQP